jgi:isocitrate dehydrogenase
MKRDITKNADGTFKVVESNVVEKVTRDQLVKFKEQIENDIDRMEKSIDDLKKQKKDVEDLLK